MYTNKYRNIKHNGFDSLGEERRYHELLLMEKAGLISDLKTQVRYELIPKQVINGKTYKKCEYVADFVYTEDGKTIVEDFKGIETEVFKIKRKLFIQKYGLEIRITNGKR